MLSDIAASLLVIFCAFALLFLAVEVTYLISTFVARRRAKRFK